MTLDLTLQILSIKPRLMKSVNGVLAQVGKKNIIRFFIYSNIFLTIIQWNQLEKNTSKV